MSNKLLKRDRQHTTPLACFGFCDYGVTRKLSHSVVSFLSERYVFNLNRIFNVIIRNHHAGLSY